MTEPAADATPPPYADERPRPVSQLAPLLQGEQRAADGGVIRRLEYIPGLDPAGPDSTDGTEL